MQKLIAGLHKFRSEVFPEKQDLYQRLSHSQHPDALFITCSDSRVDPHLVTQSEPGELFIHRNAGNIVPPWSPQANSEAASVEYAVEKLGVQSIVVCGHTGCGAMAGLLQPDAVADVPSVQAWIRYAEPVYRLVLDHYADRDPAARLTVLVEENVLAQIENLRTHPAVKWGLARGKLELYAWVYKIATGEVFQYSGESGQFELIESTANPVREPVSPRRSMALPRSL